MDQQIRTSSHREPWNKGKLVGQKAPLRLKDVWAIRIRLQLGNRIRGLASCPVQFETTDQTREALAAWIHRQGLRGDNFLFPSRLRASPRLSMRQYARIVHAWVKEVGRGPAAYGTHTLRRTKASLIYRRTKNLRAV